MTGQRVTQALRDWILQRARDGVAADALLESLRASGWDEAVARGALESTLHPPAAAVPGPALQGSPLHLDAGDRRVTVLGVLQSPRLVLFGNLLSDEECEALVAAARPRMSRSLTVGSGGDEVNDDRTSRGMFFERGEIPLVQRLEQRMARLLNWPVENGEGLQVLQYTPGAEYRPHYDYFDTDRPGSDALLAQGGQRVGTLVVYLSEPEAGGGTSFPDAGLELAPRRGNAVFFSYARPHPDTRTLHAGMPVLAGEKWIATKWLRQRKFG